jgi:hypothetical protein
MPEVEDAAVANKRIWIDSDKKRVLNGDMHTQ